MGRNRFVATTSDVLRAPRRLPDEDYATATGFRLIRVDANCDSPAFARIIAGIQWPARPKPPPGPAMPLGEVMVVPACISEPQP